ncbi:MAG: ABC transporter substrate-binding protein [Deltaproteobacteria bacterium]|nr:ABC transporter substrate-binding protein [Deltaproteobacteria bacterium]
MRRCWLFKLAMSIMIVFTFLSCKSEPKEIKIGFIGSLTGNFSAYGKRALEGTKLAIEEINKNGGINGKRLVLYLEDDRSMGEPALESVTKLVEFDKVNVILAFASPPALALAGPKAEQEKVVFVSSRTITSTSNEAGEYLFQSYSEGTLEAIELAIVARSKLKAKSASILYSNVPVAINLAQVFKKNFQERGGEIASFDFYPPKRTNFKADVEAIKRHEPDVIYIVGDFDEMLLIAKTISQLGLKKHVIVSGISGAEVIQEIQKYTDKLIFLAPDLSISNIQAEIVKLNVSREQMDLFVGEAYDITHYLAYIIGKYGSSSEMIAQGIMKEPIFTGVNGRHKMMRGNQNPQIQPVMTIKDGRYVPLD